MCCFRSITVRVPSGCSCPSSRSAIKRALSPCSVDHTGHGHDRTIPAPSSIVSCALKRSWYAWWSDQFKDLYYNVKLPTRNIPKLCSQNKIDNFFLLQFLRSTVVFCTPCACMYRINKQRARCSGVLNLIFFFTVPHLITLQINNDIIIIVTQTDST